MRRIFHVWLVAVFSLGLVVAAGNTFAQDATIVGYVTSGIGSYSTSPAVGDGTSDIINDSEAQIEARGGDDPVTARFRLRIRDGNNALAAIRHRVTWKVSDALKLDFEGYSFGQNYTLNGYVATTVGHFGRGFTIGDLRADQAVVGVNWRGLDVTYSLGAMEVGAAILTECRPSCGTVTEDMTVIPHFWGKFGSLIVSALAASASGTDAAGESVTASTTEVDVVFKTDAMTIGLVIESGTDAGEKGTSGLAVGGKFGPIHAKYTALTPEDGTEQTELSAAYMITLSKKANMMLGFASYSATPDGGDASTASLIIASAATNW